MDRCLFIQHEISCMFVDDFLVLPYRVVWAHVVEALAGPAERHDFLWRGTH